MARSANGAGPSVLSRWLRRPIALVPTAVRCVSCAGLVGVRVLNRALLCTTAFPKAASFRIVGLYDEATENEESRQYEFSTELHLISHSL